MPNRSENQILSQRDRCNVIILLMMLLLLLNNNIRALNTQWKDYFKRSSQRS
jgi:hypothetical protein